MEVCWGPQSQYSGVCLWQMGRKMQQGQRADQHGVACLQPIPPWCVEGKSDAE